MAKYGIDLGHGCSYDGGAVGIIPEERIINEVGASVISKLKALGHEVVELRPAKATSTSNSLYQRYTKSDAEKCDYCVSIHANAGGGNGAEIFTYGGKDVMGASVILSELNKLGFRNRGIKDGSGLAMVKRPVAKACLIEVCFVDSNDVQIYHNVGAGKIATVIVEGLTGQKVVAPTKYKIGWNQDSKGWWFSTDGNDYYKAEWKLINGDWYSFKDDGYAKASEWELYKGTWYFLKSDCRMAKAEWIDWKGKKYYVDSDGKMLADTTVKIGRKNYTFDKDGALI